MILPRRSQPLVCPTRVLLFGGGQDSTALLYRYYYDALFRQQYAPACHLLVVMSDTGNEFPATLVHVAQVQAWCKEVGIEFHFLTSDQGYHRPTWTSLTAQMERNDTIMGVAFPKSCTEQLKIGPTYRFLEDWLRANYHYGATDYRVFDQYRMDFGQLVVWIGFAAGEESRVREATTADVPVAMRAMADATGQLSILHTPPKVVSCTIPRWRQRTVVRRYPLIELGLNRLACQTLIADYGHTVPIPSNCMLCPYQNEAEIVYLFRRYPAMFTYWEERERAKLVKFSQAKLNLGIKGKRTLRQTLEKALLKYGHWHLDELEAYRFSHGHCVASKY